MSDSGHGVLVVIYYALSEMKGYEELRGNYFNVKQWRSGLPGVVTAACPSSQHLWEKIWG